jgi:hypothetical protein
MERSIIYRCVWIPSAIALIAITVAFSRGPVVNAAPGKLIPFTTDDHAISIQHPDNWKPHAESMNAVVTTVHFDPAPDIHFGVKADLVGSLLADTSRPPGGMPPDSSGQGGMPGSGDASGQPGMPGGADSSGGGGGGDMAAQLQSLSAQNPQLSKQLGSLSKDPLTAAHQRQQATLEGGGQYPGMKEGETQKIRVAGYDALTTDFTFQNPNPLSPEALSGTRITVLSGERQISIVGYCPTKDFNTYGPVFLKMLNSLDLGQGGSR